MWLGHEYASWYKAPSLVRDPNHIDQSPQSLPSTQSELWESSVLSMTGMHIPSVQEAGGFHLFREDPVW